MSLLWFRRACGIVGSVLIGVLTAGIVLSQQAPPRFGGAYSELGERRQQLVDDWVERFNKATGQGLDARSFYDDILSLSSKTTFDAVTHALVTTPLTDGSGNMFGDALSLVERIDTVRGEVSGTASDRQFRMYVRLMPDAREALERSREFKRGADNAIYHKGYPVNYREQRGTPSIQVSIALDNRQADIDVDYRSSRFPTMLFNGHLSASNSDVRAGDNAERHAERWTGFQNWWRSFFGVQLERAPEASDATSAPLLPKIPRAGKKDIKVMVPDFLQAWLVEGNVAAAMGYVAERSYACLAQDTPDPSAFDRGVAPFQILVNLKAAYDALGKHDSLEGLTIGVPLGISGLRPVSHPHQEQFAPLRRARQHRGKVRLREPVDAGRDERLTRVRPSLWCDLPHRRGRDRTHRSRCCGPRRTAIGKSCPGRRRRHPMSRQIRRRRPSPMSCESRPTWRSSRRQKTSWTRG